ncbi:unnamed protein product [Diamesa serratosioi]
MAPKFFFHEPTQNSNLIVYALDKKYYLHKIFLEQSPYFEKLMSKMRGNELSLLITDRQITLDSIDFVFCFIYEAHVELNNNVFDVAAILATAAFFQFKSLLNLATKKVMHLCTVKNNAYALYNLVDIPELKSNIFKYLEINLMIMERFAMKEINIITMRQLILSEDFVITSEMDLYRMLQKWFLELVDSSMLGACSTVDSIFSLLNVANLTQYPNIRGLKKDKLIPIEMIHDATDANCEMIIRLLGDVESIPEATKRVLHRYAKVVWKTMGEQAWIGKDYRLGFSIKYFISERGLRFEKTSVENVAFVTQQSHKLSFDLQVYSLRSTELEPVLKRTLVFDCKIPYSFTLITSEELRLPKSRYPLVVSVKTSLLPKLLEAALKKPKEE